MEQFQKHLLGQEKGYQVDQLLTDGRKFEAINMGKNTFKDLAAQPHTEANAITTQRCHNCGRKHHQPKKCPANYLHVMHAAVLL